MTASLLPPSFTVDRAYTAGSKRRFDVTLNTRPPCPECGPHGRIHSRGFIRPDRWVILDLPHGLPVELHVRRRRFECAVCNSMPGATVRTFSERGPDIHPRYDMTKRLHAFVLPQLARTPLRAIADQTGIPPSTLWHMAIALSQRLEAGHRFPTPAVLAMDGIKIRGTEYMVIGDGITGLPIGFLKSMQAETIRGWAHQNIDVPAVKVFVADLHRTNTSIARLKFPNATYVADKWHVIRQFQKVMSSVINKEIDRLRKSGQRAEARTIYDFKPGLMAVNKRLRRSRRTAKGGGRPLDFYNDLAPILKSNPDIRHAFWARYDFVRFYRAPTFAAARPWFVRFQRHAQPFAHLPAYQAFEKHLWDNWALIGNYFDTVTLRTDGRWRGLTTNALEQHNGQIRKRLRARNGVQNQDMLRLIAVYGARRIGEEILLCAGEDCNAAIGPVYGPPAGFEVRAASATYWHCPNCR